MSVCYLMKCNEPNWHANYAAMCAVYFYVEVLLTFDDRPFTHIAMNWKCSALTAVKKNRFIFLELRFFFLNRFLVTWIYGQDCYWAEHQHPCLCLFSIRHNFQIRAKNFSITLIRHKKVFMLYLFSLKSAVSSLPKSNWSEK